jgi:MFS family permease
MSLLLPSNNKGPRKRQYLHPSFAVGIMNRNNEDYQQQRQPLSATSTSLEATTDDDIDNDLRPSCSSLQQPQHQQTLDSFLELAYQSSKLKQQQQQQQPSHKCSNSSWLHQWKYWCIILSLGIANSSDASEILCLSYILSDNDFQKHMLRRSQQQPQEEEQGDQFHDDQQQSDASGGGGDGGFLAAAVFLGMLIGGLMVGTTSDWVGRKPVLLLGLCGNALAGIVSSMAPNVEVLIVLRCLAGLGIGATVPPLFTLVTELAPPSIRGFCVTVCASFWMVGSIYVALVALWLLEAWAVSWRVFAIACALPSAVGAILVFWWVPESPRFLGLEQRSKEATDNANLLARRMGYHGPPLSIQELQHSFPPTAIQDFEAHRLQRLDSRTDTTRYIINTPTGRLIRLWQFLQRTNTDLIHSASKLYTPSLKRTTLPLQMVWFSLSFGSYGLLTWINTIFVQVHIQNVYSIALLFAISNLPGNVITGLWMDRVGRGVMLTGSIVTAATSLVVFAICATTSDSTGIVISACCFQCFTIAAWNTIDTMTSELFPTLVRSTGMGICTASGRVGAMVAQFVNGALINHGRPVMLLLVASATLVLGAATPCLLPNGGDMTGQPVHDDVVILSATTSTTTGGRNEMPPYQRIGGSLLSSSTSHPEDGDHVDQVLLSSSPSSNITYRDKPTNLVVV